MNESDPAHDDPRQPQQRTETNRLEAAADDGAARRAYLRSVVAATWKEPVAGDPPRRLSRKPRAPRS